MAETKLCYLCSMCACVCVFLVVCNFNCKRYVRFMNLSVGFHLNNCLFVLLRRHEYALRIPICRFPACEDCTEFFNYNITFNIQPSKNPSSFALSLALSIDLCLFCTLTLFSQSAPSICVEMVRKRV